MPFISEKELSSHIKTDSPARIYFLFGEEDFLTQTYVEKIIKRGLGKNISDFDFSSFLSDFTSNQLEESVESLPFGSHYKLILITDYDADKDNIDEFNKKLKILSDIPDYTIIIFSFKSLVVDYKKPKAKMKKLILSAEKQGFVVEFKHMNSTKISEMIVKKCGKKNINISKDNAKYLSEILGNKLSDVGIEVEKLCAFATDLGTIERKDIDLLVPKQAEAKIFSLADNIFMGNVQKSIEILDDLLWQRVDPIVIISVLSSAYLDIYRGIIGTNDGIFSRQAAVDFSYPKNREFLITKAFSKARSYRLDYIKSCINSLFLADLKLKTTSLNSRIILEETITKLLAVRR